MNRPIPKREAAGQTCPSNDRVAEGEDDGSPPAAAVAAALVSVLENKGIEDLLHIAGSNREAEDVAQALRQFLPQAEILLLPSWDCLPYDKVWPTRDNMGRRLRVLHAITQASKLRRITVTSIESALQRVPPPLAIARAFTTLQVGQTLDRELFKTTAERIGYVVDDRVDEPGEIALRGDLIDVFPAGDVSPVRIVLDAQTSISELKTYDPISQRSERSHDLVLLGPASELIFQAGNHPEVAAMRTTSMEERLVSLYGSLPSLFDVAWGASISFLAGLEGSPLARILDLVEDASRARREIAGSAKPLPDQFYLSRDDWKEAVRNRQCLRLSAATARTPKFFQASRSGHEFAEYVKTQTSSGVSVVVTGRASELQRADKLLVRKLGRRMEKVADWAQIRSAAGGSLLKAEFNIEEGFADPKSRLAVIAAADIFGPVLRAQGNSPQSVLDPELRIGDVVVHEEHGLGVLAAVEQVDLAGQRQDIVRLEYRDGASLLVPVSDFCRIWRYGSDPGAVPLDRLDGDGWSKRHRAAFLEIGRLGRRLVALSNARSNEPAEIIRPPRADLARFAARFPYAETPDQAEAIRAVLDDLSSGRTMNRLICGDVGFGKTEIALRACAAVALSGKQVAVVTPTTVLARQHYETFSRRFAGTGLQVAHLSRVVGASEARKVKEGLRDGRIAVVVATHAVAAKGVTFADLGLLVIDEEHRFGVKLKQALRNLAPRLHTLSMSATPIPRTLQSAMAGIQEVSVLNTPPARRRPVRTMLAPFDAGSARAALLREYRRSGQSFFVVPRIEDIEPIAHLLDSLVPELTVKTAHGKMKVRVLDEIVVRFADGDGDVLLSTDIVESGLDVPRANTIVIWRADRFGLAQLHQLRGRVGRGRVQGVAFLLTEPDAVLADETRARLSTMLALDRLGSGLSISQRDLDLRGAGDIFGEEQVGHMKLIGAGLYLHLLERAVSRAAGAPNPDKQLAEINVQVTAAFSESYVPEPAVRLSLYTRLCRMSSEADISAFADELEDRFGTMPGEVATLLKLTALRIAAAEMGVSKVDVGPESIAMSFRTKSTASQWRGIKAAEGFGFRNGRLIFRRSQSAAPELGAVRSALDALRSAKSSHDR
ncbi:DEAD/DEAH box helicase [Mesorhizobium sp. M0047]|uniref:DEAD/DEAH box helicase n=1 Tax=Mesorhizobium sp. M0047 TaxID=2956859 RepID=UPI0033389A2C